MTRGHGGGGMAIDLTGGDLTEEIHAGPGSVFDGLRADFEACGLSGSESRVLLALVQLGTATPSELAQSSGVHRTSVYGVLDSLGAKRLAEALPGSLVRWASPGHDEVIHRLTQLQEERWKALEARLDRAGEKLATIAGDGRRPGVPVMHVLRDAHQVKTSYDRLVARATTELLVFNRPPYSWSPQQVNPVVIDALQRGVSTRVLYQAVQINEPGASGVRAAMEAYHAAGVMGRVVAELPMKLTVVDRTSVLLSVPDPADPAISFPSSLLVEQPGFAAFAAAAFEQYWADATPYDAFVAPNNISSIDTYAKDRA